MTDDKSETNSTMRIIATLIDVVNESFTGVNSALKVVTNVKDLIKSDPTGIRREVREQLVDLTDQLLTVKEQNSSLRRVLLDMEEQLNQIQKFEADAGNYVLQKVGPRSFAYVAKGTAKASDDMPHYCAHCFDNKQMSILQLSQAGSYTDIMSYPSCGGETHISVERGARIIAAPQERYDPYDM